MGAHNDGLGLLCALQSTINLFYSPWDLLFGLLSIGVLVFLKVSVKWLSVKGGICMGW